VEINSTTSFGALLRDHRRAAGLTQAELAERAGLSWRGVNDLERGARRTPHHDTLARLVAALGLTGEERAALEAAARRPLASAPTISPVAAERDYQLALPGLPSDFPALKTLDRRAHNLPVQPTPLLGREEAFAAVCALLRRDDTRLVTMTGPGGVGKTRLALQVAAELVEVFEDGVWFSRLSRLTDPRLVLPTIAQTLELTEIPSQSIAETLSAYLSDRQALLVLDNFEQLVATAPDIAALLESARRVKTLITSRVPLRLRGEQEYPLTPLALPDIHQLPSPDLLSQYGAVALFIERAGEARPGFTMTMANAPAIAELCSRLDGLPLAIELAAVRVKVLPPEALLARLNSQLTLLTGGARDLEARQQTMRATIAWSEQLLRPVELVLFRRLAVFVGGATLEALEAVCLTPNGVEPLEINALDGLGALVDHSLVQQREEGGEPRFGMLHVIREYALERLEASDGGMEAATLRRAHLAYYLALAEGRETAPFGPQAAAWLEWFEQERDNIREALAWARRRGEQELGLRLAGALTHTWEATGYYSEGRSWLESLLALAPTEASPSAPPAGGSRDGSREPEVDTAGTGVIPVASTVSAMTRAKALCGVGVCAYRQKEYEPALAALAASLELARNRSPGWVAGLAVHLLGKIAQDRGDLERAEADVAESVARAADEPGLAASFTLELGNIARDRGDLEQATTYFEEGLALARRAGSEYAAGDALGDLADMARRRGDLTRAERLGREQLSAWRRLGVRGYLAARGLENLALISATVGDGARAARLWGAAAALCERMGAPPQLWRRVETEQAVAAARATLGEEAWAAAFAAGQVLSLDEAMAEELGSG
jgi:predicted ATPase/transcriptional regulator with XRE-family HTH domain